MGMSPDYLVIRPLRTAEEVAAVRTASAADPNGHPALFPSHVAMLHGEIVGSLSVLATPLIGVWSHSEKMTARNTRELINTCVNIARTTNRTGQLLTMCGETSPIYPYVPHFGFTKLGATTVFLMEDK